MNVRPISSIWPVVVPMLVALFTVAGRRGARTTWWLAGLAVVPVAVQLLRTPHPGTLGAASAVAGAALVGAAVGWGLFVAGLRERSRRAARDAALRAQQARQRAREDIAREMHDVLAHRLTLLSMYAGALEFHPGAPTEQLAEAAGVIRRSAHQALEDLQEILRVLRTPTITSHAEPPRPTLREMTQLIEETRAAGLRVDLDQRLQDLTTLDAMTARTAHRALQETLTNHRKHAAGTTLSLTLSGAPGEGLRLVAANPLPPASGTRSRPSGQGLIGMNERVQLAGGRMSQHRTAETFRLEVWLPWAR
nr:histidine kinase [Streptomyces sp. SID2888]